MIEIVKTLCVEATTSLCVELFCRFSSWHGVLAILVCEENVTRNFHI